MKTSLKLSNPPKLRNNGSALIVSLSILLVLTILGVASMQTTSLQEKMAGNSRDAQVAFQAAEAALRTGEAFVFDTVGLGDFAADGNGSGYFTSRVGDLEAWKIEANWNNAVQTAYAANVARVPHYMVQVLDTTLGEGESAALNTDYGQTFELRNVQVFQITARGYGISPNTRVMLQSYYGKL